MAQNFAGSNAPGLATNFSFTIASGATNLVLVITNSASAWSHLLLKKGGTPTDTDFDFIARLDGKTNVIALDAPEFALTNYGLRVRTPAASAPHMFTVALTTNRTDLRTANFPVLKPVAFTTTATLTNAGAGNWHYYQVDVPTNLPGWRVVVSANSGLNPDLYVRRGALPTSSVFDKRSTGELADTVVFTDAEATNGTYFIGVNLPTAPVGSSTYTLSAAPGFEQALAWDSGATQDGTQVYTNQSNTGGDYYFKITTQPTSVGAWRTALKVISGEADVYLRPGAFAPGPSGYTKQSTRPGSDGMVLALTQEYSVGQEWRILVRATPGAQWTLVSGEAHVLNLGNVAAPGSEATSTNVVVGPEGLRLFKATPPAGTLAWRLGLNGATNEIFLRKTLAATPYSASTYEQRQRSQMLVVPNYLVGGDSYYLSVPGAPGETINLDNRQQAVVDLPFSGNTNLTVSSYGYSTFRVQVPVQQIAWAVEVNTTAGDANVALRRGLVPNEWNNDAFSDVPGQAREQVLLVPPTLSDGTFYVTVYGTNAYTCKLTSGNPTITDIPFAGTITNDAPNLVGWRLYRVPDINSQLGILGWDLFLAGQPPGTEIALRRNAVPGRWNYRNNSTSASSQGNVDYTSTAGFLQRQDHQADIWYVGVYQPASALGSFVLNRQTYSLETIEPAGNATNITAQPANQFRYFRVDVPAGVTGWDLRLTNVTSGDPRLSVRRDRLPDNLSTHLDNSGSGWSASASSSWGSGNQWAPGTDWTGYANSATGTNESGRVLAMGMGNPLQPGTYYVGVIGPSGATTPLSYTLASHFIGDGQAIPVVPLNFDDGVATISNLPPREAAHFSVTVPANVASWRLGLTNTVGEASLLVQKTTPANIGAGGGAPYSMGGGAKVSKLGDESYLLLPPSGQTNVPAGTYYLAIVSEGMSPGGARIGSNTWTGTIESRGELPVADLGALAGADVIQSDALASLEVKAYRFTLPAGLLGVELRLENRVGNPRMSLRAGTDLPAPTDNYGSVGGQTATWSDSGLIYLPNPAPGTYTLLVQASALNGNYPAAAYAIRLHSVGSSPLAFDGGLANVVAQPSDTWRYFAVTVPSNAVGWDLRLLNVTGGDPRLVVTRGPGVPRSLSTLTSGNSGWGVGSATTWPPAYQWAPGTDMTGYAQDADGTNRSGRTLVCGMGNPLEPGDYLVGIAASTGSSTPMTYALSSRGIGAGFAIPVTDLAFNGGVSNVLNLPPRDLAWFRVQVPSNTPSWKLSLAATQGDSLLVVQRGALPNINASSGSATTLAGGRVVRKVGDEFFHLLPASGQSNILSGTYYLTLVSEGVNPTSTRAGTNTSSALLTSFGALTNNSLGTLTPAAEISLPGVLAGGALQTFQFNVATGVLSMQLRLTNRVGNPRMTLRRGPLTPSLFDSYGNEGGSSYEWQDAAFIDIPNPTPGLHTLVVQAAASGGYPDASFNLLIQASGATPMAFDGGVQNITNQPAGIWRYFYVTVPTNAAGWDLRLTNVTSGDPRLVIRREQLPTGLSSLTVGNSGWGVASATSFPTGYQWAASSDWTGYANGADGTNESGHVLAAGFGNPLEAGNYYIGVINGTGPGNANPMSYSLVSRGIGDGFTIPVTSLALNSTVTNASLAVREAAYYRVTIPSNTPAWKLRLAPGVGEAVLAVNRTTLPSVLAGTANAVSAGGGHRMQKSGNEQYLLLPAAGQTNLVAGDYFIAVASEGVNPVSTRSGSNAVSFALTSSTAFAPEALGALGGNDLLRTKSLEGGEVAAYQFSVPPGTPGLEVRLENRVGFPRMTLRRGAGVPAPYDAYGNDGGEGYTWQDPALITIANPAATNYTLTVQAGLVSSAYPDASFDLRIRQLPVPGLNFAGNLNTNGLTNVVSATLSDNQRAYFRVDVPATNNGGAVLGWRLDLHQAFGSATLRAREDTLPSDADSNLMPFTASQAVLVPPFLTPGTWYVEVKAAGATSFTLTSSSVALERPAWDMPQFGHAPPTPGLAAPDFGDSGVQTNGSALPGDQGVDVEQGGFHYFAINVPEFNGGLLRVVLEAISGNPDFYLRQGALPTVTHNATGIAGSLYDRLLNGTGTEYANWVALDGRYQPALPAGTWYVAVRAAGNSNARYRLKLSTGNVQDIPLHGASLTNQIVAAKDFRYYRVVVPTNAPSAWTFSFTQQIGDVLVYLRDTTPPGQTTTVTDYIDWSTDNKNHGPYPTFDASGSYAINTPPLRPGHVYFLGFRGLSDSTFTLTTATNGASINVAAALDFYTGTVTSTVPAFGKLTWRIDVPSDARRWRHTNSGPATLQWYLDQGSLPTLTASDHWLGAGNASLNQSLYAANNWPWLPAQMYFLTVTNTSASPQNFTLALDGRNCANDDNDNDTLPDCWETAWFGNLSQTATGDADHDGNNNLLEFQDGTNPTDATSLLARLTVITNGTGSVDVLPSPGPYAYGTPVTLTATPVAGQVFSGWSGAGIASSTNPLVIAMTTNRTITANFSYDYGAPGEVRADYQFQSNLLSSVGNPPPLGLVNAGHYFTNQSVDGVSRTVLRWPQGSGLMLQPTTAVFPSNSYTLVLLFKLDNVTGYRRLFDPKNTTVDRGLYVRDGKLTVYNNSGESVICVTNNTWHQIVLTRDAANQVAVYCDGIQRLNYTDSTGAAIISSDTARFFKDDATEDSGGWVARIRNFATALTPAEVVALDRLPGSSGPGGEPFVLSHPLLLGDGAFVFQVTGPAVPVRLESSTNLTFWSTVTNLNGFAGSHWHTNVSASGRQFFRARRLNP